jgi:hypothetical protein
MTQRSPAGRKQDMEKTNTADLVRVRVRRCKPCNTARLVRPCEKTQDMQEARGRRCLGPPRARILTPAPRALPSFCGPSSRRAGRAMSYAAVLRALGFSRATIIRIATSMHSKSKSVQPADDICNTNVASSIEGKHAHVFKNAPPMPGRVSIYVAVGVFFFSQFQRLTCGTALHAEIPRALLPRRSLSPTFNFFQTSGWIQVRIYSKKNNNCQDQNSRRSKTMCRLHCNLSYQAAGAVVAGGMGRDTCHSSAITGRDTPLGHEI